MEILLAVDFSDSTEKLLGKVETITSALSAKLWVVHVAEPDPDFVGFEAGPQTVRDSLAKHFHQEHRQLQDIAAGFRNAGLEATALLVQGPTVETILSEAEKLGVGMIVVGSHGHGAMYQLLMGSVSEGVIEKSGQAVLVIPTHQRS